MCAASPAVWSKRSALPNRPFELRPGQPHRYGRPACGPLMNRWSSKWRVLAAPLMAFCLSCAGRSGSDSDEIPLSGTWQLFSSAEINADGEQLSSPEGHWTGGYSTEVPGTVLAALVENGVYPDPFYGRNLQSLPGYRVGRWLAMPPESPFYPTWWYRRTFRLPEHFNGKNLILIFDGINYKANIWFNGMRIADSTRVIGMFRRFDFDVTDAARPGETNVIAVQVSAPGKLPDIRYRTKQLEATTGWDDHNPQPPDLNMGIWRDVRIRATGPVTLEHPYVVTDLDLPSLERARLTVSVRLHNLTSEKISGVLEGRIESTKFSQTVALGANEEKTVLFHPDDHQALNLVNPRLWWPHPLGPQNLYLAELSFRANDSVSDRRKVRFGIREVSTYINDEGWRGYKVNGRNVLIRGGAWMTSDMLLRLTHRRYDALIRYAREANLNMLRSEGFSIRETDEFYDLCDQYGVMVTQQIFGRSIPDEDLAVANVEDMILRIRNHPSLVHFLGHDETFPTPSLDRAYRDLIETYTPERTYQPHSGAFHIEQRYQTGGTRTGTLELWTYVPPAHYYTHKADGAWGFAQSGGIGGVVAPYESMRRMMPESALWPVFNETFSFHTVLQSVDYFGVLIDAMRNRYGEPQDIEEFCRKGWVSNYESARAMFEAYGRNKYDALGITTWKYDAAWPASITWQYIDWFLNATGAYYGAKKACEALHVQYSYDDHSICVVNGLYRDFQDLKVDARLLDFDLAEKVSRSATVDVPPDGVVRVFSLEPPGDLSGCYFIRLKLSDRNGEPLSDNFYWLSTVPDLEGEKGYRTIEQGWDIMTATPRSYSDFTRLQDLERVTLDVSAEIRPGVQNEKNPHSSADEFIAAVKVRNPSDRLAFFIHLAAVRETDGLEIAPAFWSDNCFALLPGESRTVHARFYSRDLDGSPARIKIGGWNIEPGFATLQEDK